MVDRCICGIDESSLRLFMLCQLIPDRILENGCCMKRLKNIYESDRGKFEMSWKVLCNNKEAMDGL